MKESGSIRSSPLYLSLSHTHTHTGGCMGRACGLYTSSPASAQYTPWNLRVQTYTHTHTHTRTQTGRRVQCLKDTRKEGGERERENTEEFPPCFHWATKWLPRKCTKVKFFFVSTLLLDRNARVKSASAIRKKRVPASDKTHEVPLWLETWKNCSPSCTHALG